MQEIVEEESKEDAPRQSTSTHLGDIEGDVRCTEGERPLKRARTGHGCDICNTSYSEKRTLMRHLKTPAHCRKAGILASSYECEICGHAFSRNDLRQRHEKEVHFKIKRSTGFNATPATNLNLHHPVNFENEDTPLDNATTDSSKTSLDCTISSKTTKSSRSEGQMDGIAFGVPATSVSDEGFMSGDCVIEASLGSVEKGGADCEAPSYEGQNLSTAFAEASTMQAVEVPVDNISLRSSTSSNFQSMPGHLQAAADLPRSILIYKGASPRLRGFKAPVQCVLCQDYLGSNLQEIRAHLHQHFKHLSPQFLCDNCQLAFTLERDLKFHRNCAAEGHCGFNFEHGHRCEGHHPPDVYSEMLTDNDRMQFSVRFRHWEQAQLNLYLDMVTDLINGSPLPADTDCWSVGALLNSLDSLSSTIGQRKPRSTFESGGFQTQLQIPRRSIVPSTRKRLAFASTRVPLNLASAALIGDIKKVSRLVRKGFPMNSRYAIISETSSCRAGDLLLPLEAAVIGHQLETAELLILQGANVHELDGPGPSPFSICVEHGEPDMMRVLLQSGDNAHSNGVARDAALYDAVSLGHREIAELLLQHSDNTNAAQTSINLVKVAVSHNDLGMLLMLLWWMSDRQPSWVDNKEGALEAAVFDAVLSGSKEVADVLLRHGASVNAEQGSQSLLMVAIAREDIRMIRLLLQYNPVLSALDDLRSAHRIAMARGPPKVLQMLLDLAIEEDDIRTAKVAIDHGARADKFDAILPVPLFRCIDLGRIQIARLILLRGADVNAMMHSKTALGLAVIRGNEAAVKMLLNFGADVNARIDTSSVLEAAVDLGNLGTIDILLSRGVLVHAWHYRLNPIVEERAQKFGISTSYILGSKLDPDCYLPTITLFNSVTAVETWVDHYGVDTEITGFGRLLHYAACYDRGEIVKLLLARGADVNEDSGAYGRPLAWAISHGHINIVNVLLTNGAELDNWPGPFPNALTCAVRCDRVDIVGLLLERDNGQIVVERSLGSRVEEMWSEYRTNAANYSRRDVEPNEV